MVVVQPRLSCLLVVLVLGWAAAAPAAAASSSASKSALASASKSAVASASTPALQASTSKPARASSPASSPALAAPSSQTKNPNVVQGELQNVHSLASGPFLQLINFSLGNQAMSGVFDTGSSDVVAPVTGSTLCKDPLQQCDSNAASQFVAGSFDPGVASALDVSVPYNHTFGDGVGVTGTYVETMAKVGNGEVPLQVGTMSEGKLRSDEFLFPIFGIGPIQGEDAQPREYANLPARMKSMGMITSNVFSVWTNDFRSGNGSVLFGGVDLAKFEGDKLKFLPLERTIDGILPAFVTPISSVRLQMAKGNKGDKQRRSEAVYARDDRHNNNGNSNHKNNNSSKKNKDNGSRSNSNDNHENNNNEGDNNRDNNNKGNNKNNNNKNNNNNNKGNNKDNKDNNNKDNKDNNNNNNSKGNKNQKDSKNGNNNDSGNLAPDGALGLFETSTSGMSLPKPALQAVAKMLDTPVTKEGDLGLTDCSLINSESKLIIGFDNDRAKINVPLDTLSLPRKFLNGTDKCQLFIGTDEDELTILGAAFLQNVYVVFDMDRQAMHVAQAKVNVTESNIKEFKLEEHVEEPDFDDEKKDGKKGDRGKDKGNGDKQNNKQKDGNNNNKQKDGDNKNSKQRKGDDNKKNGDNKKQDKGRDRNGDKGSGSTKSISSIESQGEDDEQEHLSRASRKTWRGGVSYRGGRGKGAIRRRGALPSMARRGLRYK